MQDRVDPDIGAEGHTADDDKRRRDAREWDAIDWNRASQRVRNLRQRIYRATQDGQWNQVRSLKKRMMRSHANLLLSIRRVTQDNEGKKTAGLDGQVALSSDDRGHLIQEMKEYKPWHVTPARRVYIPKANGKQRPLGIPIIKDRIAQAIVKNALEPSWEARFEANSYGYRPGRSGHDAIEQCWGRLNSIGGHTWILDADIKGAFDNINHDFILNAIGQTPGRGWIKEWLKAGYVEAEMFHATESGTPQGGVLSPLLANIALDGMDRWLSRMTKQRTYTHKSGKKAGQGYTRTVAQYGFVRYADDFIITAATREDIEAIKPQVAAWLAERGLRLNEEKTRIRHIADGIDFLGFTIRRFGRKCLSKPQKEKVLAKLREIKGWLAKHPNMAPETVIEVLNTILRGWANYYKHSASKQTFAYVDHRLVHLLLRWARKRHPSKGPRWVVARYFTRVGGDNWVFFAKTKDRRGHPVTTYLYKVAKTPIVRHVKVKGSASPDDSALSDYWEARRTRYGKSYFARGSKLYRVAESQHWHCPLCHEHLFTGDTGIHVHHMTPIANGGVEEQDNLRIHHQSCHVAVHGRMTRRKSTEVGAA